MKRFETFDELLGRLSARSVDKQFDAYADVAWDDPEHQIDPADPRFALDEGDCLGATEWYRSQPEERRAEIGLALTVQQMKVGLIFENVLTKGLLNFAMTLPNGSPAFRYAYHEVIEESQHTLMFQEFINRSGMSPPGLTGLDAFGARLVPGMGRSFPELFFLFVLGGEAPIDYVQRRQLEKRNRDLHPLLERIMRIHVMEEARHICFAKRFLQERVPTLSTFKTWHLRIRAPIILSRMSAAMLEPPQSVIWRYGIPAAVVKEAYVDDPRHRDGLMDGLAALRALCVDLAIVTPSTVWLWERLGIWPKHQRLLAASS